MPWFARSKQVRRIVAAATFFSLGLDAAAEEPRQIVPFTKECVYHAADTFDLPRLSLILVLAQESGTVGKCSPPNKNGTVDCGPGQVNESEIKKLAPLLHVSEAEAMRRVRDDGCFNILVSAFILKQKLKAAGGQDLWDAMGRYNSATPSIKKDYQNELLKQFRRLKKKAQG